MCQTLRVGSVELNCDIVPCKNSLLLCTVATRKTVEQIVCSRISVVGLL